MGDKTEQKPPKKLGPSHTGTNQVDPGVYVVQESLTMWPVKEGKAPPKPTGTNQVDPGSKPPLRGDILFILFSLFAGPLFGVGFLGGMIYPPLVFLCPITTAIAALAIYVTTPTPKQVEMVEAEKRPMFLIRRWMPCRTADGGGGDPRYNPNNYSVEEGGMDTGDHLINVIRAGKMGKIPPPIKIYRRTAWQKFLSFVTLGRWGKPRRSGRISRRSP